MRDLIWTLIIVWVVYKLISAFQSAKKNSGNTFFKSESANNRNHSNEAKSRFENEGDYIDFEELP